MTGNYSPGGKYYWITRRQIERDKQYTPQVYHVGLFAKLLWWVNAALLLAALIYVITILPF